MGAVPPSNERFQRSENARDLPSRQEGSGASGPPGRERPATSARIERRRHKRLRSRDGFASIYTPVLFRLAGRLRDVSARGCRIELMLSTLDDRSSAEWTEVLTKRRCPLQAEIAIQDGGLELATDIEVRQGKALANGNFEIGVHFLRRSDEDEARLESILDALRADGRLEDGRQEEPAAPVEPARPDPKTDPRPSEPGNALTTRIKRVFALRLPFEPTEPARPDPKAAPRPAEPKATLTTRIGRLFVSRLPFEAATPETPPAPDAKPGPRGKRLGEILVNMGALTRDQAEDAAAWAKLRRERLGRFLLREGLVNDSVLCEAFAAQSGLPRLPEPFPTMVSMKLAGIFPPLTLKWHSFVPIGETKNSIAVAATYPLAAGVLARLERTAGKRLAVHLAPESVVLSLLPQGPGRPPVMPSALPKNGVRSPMKAR